jgi:membrane fusion protein, multidrug efflux system
VSRRASCQRSFFRLLVACGAITWLAACSEKPGPEKPVIRPVRAIQVADPSKITQREFPGQAKATQEIELSFRVAGPLITRPVNVGDEVAADDVVARIDPRDFEVNLRAVKGQLTLARAAHKRAAADYERAVHILKDDPGAISRSAVDRAEEDRDRALANVDTLEASVQAAEDALSYTYLHAPFDGQVVALYVENFEDVRAKQPIMRILDTSSIEMVVHIPENLISYAPAVTKIEATFDAFPGRAIPATIKEIGTEASRTTRTFPVTLIMKQPKDFKILAGMAGTATAPPPASLLTGKLELPVAAVFSPEEDGKSYVWVIDEGTKTVKRREVTTGELGDRGIQITSGLKSGEWVATAGIHYLSEGQQVTLLDAGAD